MNAHERFGWATITPSDISDHVPTLFAYAIQCQHITEFGVRGGVSTSAWLMAFPKTLHCYDIATPECLPELTAIANEQGIDFKFIQANTANVEIEETDLLFLDTLHTGEHLSAELKNHTRVRKYLIFHDTEHNGWIGEGGGSGLKYALIGFLLINTQWRIVYHTDTLNGLTVLERIN